MSLETLLGSTANPFSLVYDKLWEIAMVNERLAKIINPGNRVNYKEQDSPKRNTSLGDFPELNLIPQTGIYNLYANSSSTTASKTYAWIINTDSMLLSVLQPIQWELFISMAAYCCAIKDLKWNNQTFVKNVFMPEESTASTAALGLEEERGIRGWTNVITIQVDMYFRTIDLFESSGICLPCNQGAN